MKIFFALLLVPFLVLPAFAESYLEILPSDQGTLNVGLSTTPENPSPGGVVKINLDFINPQNDKVQEHIDYRMTVLKEGDTIFGPIPLTHTSTGSVSIPVELLESGTYFVLVEFEGILFQPIPAETVSFALPIGEASAQPPSNGEPTTENGGGCLIATAAFGSELSPQIQELREVRDNIVMNTESGKSFMLGFNQLYYSFSPMIADLERENQVFKETVKIAITPMISTLSILNYAEIDSEEEMLGYGIGIILLNAGIYIGLPTFGIVRFYQIRHS